jgi:hypothetical protein
MPLQKKIGLGLLVGAVVASLAGVLNVIVPPGRIEQLSSDEAVKLERGVLSQSTADARYLDQSFGSKGRDSVADRYQFGFLHEIDSSTAIYDIAAHTVYLPDGLQLEAHSGLGARLDDPRFVHEHMRGATPPNVYELIPREKPFHGVRALRLIPVGNSNIFGRKGLLAHTYMLGPKGDSNGCVVFKNYTAFLQAFESGRVRRLLVVAHVD